MDIGLATALISSRIGQIQLAIAARMLDTGPDGARAAAELIDAAQQNIDRLANVAAGIGTNIDVSA
jgi:hypothetical protein